MFGSAGKKTVVSTILVAAALLASGCAVISSGSLSKAPEEVGEGQVGMEVFSDPTGSTLLLVPVTIGDSGPYQFVLDTGASRTVIEPALVTELGLSTGGAAPGSGVSAEFQGTTVDVESWRVGDIELQARTLVSTELPPVPEGQGPQFRGLLGSDVLAGFGEVEINYDDQILTLRSAG